MIVTPVYNGQCTNLELGISLLNLLDSFCVGHVGRAVAITVELVPPRVGRSQHRTAHLGGLPGDGEKTREKRHSLDRETWHRGNTEKKGSRESRERVAVTQRTKEGICSDRREREG